MGSVGTMMITELLERRPEKSDDLVDALGYSSRDRMAEELAGGFGYILCPNRWNESKMQADLTDMVRDGRVTWDRDDEGNVWYRLKETADA